MQAISRRLFASFLVPRRAYSAASASPPQTDGEKLIHDRLSAEFEPTQLKVQDISGGCGDFYAITIASPAFKNLSTLKQHRLVQNELKDVIKSIHGLQLKTIPS